MVNKFEINGILLLDKSSGITSNKALQQIKRFLGTKSKAGHTGSLDPLATGMLPVCFGEATKFSSFLLNSDKKYLVTAQLGIKTDTGDLAGTVISKEENINYNFNEEQVNSILQIFVGEIWQTPPIYSAIKQNGVRLYKLAREHKHNIVVNPRLITIYSIKLINICSIKKQIILQVHCSKGTYIRSLIEDIAKKLHCLATVATLRRIAIGDFIDSQMISISKLENLLSTATDPFEKIDLLINKYLLPVKYCVSKLPVLTLDSKQIEIIFKGQQIKANDLHVKDNLICLISPNGNFLGVGENIGNNQIKAKRLVNYMFFDKYFIN